MPPKRTTTPMFDAAIKALVAQSVVDALAVDEANRSRNGDDSHDSGTGSRNRASYAMFLNESDEIEKYVGGLPDMIQGSVMASKPKTMQDAVEFATKLMDQKIRTIADQDWPSGPGCRSQPAVANNQRAPGENQRVLTCFECGVQGHYKRDCPKVKNKNQGNQADNGNVVAKAYAMGTTGLNPNSNVVPGTFLLNNRYASILFDTGVDRSFVSTAFSSLIDIIPTTLAHGYDWFEKMESVFHISNCTVTCQIKFATCTLFGNALTWWNSHVNTVGHDAAYGMPWKTLKKMTIDKY
ncbi:putative reverse transcriptase domain-containing protein [Tanacetum coccineum]